MYSRFYPYKNIDKYTKNNEIQTLYFCKWNFKLLKYTFVHLVEIFHLLNLH
jgi:hypothetical protein